MRRFLIWAMVLALMASPPPARALDPDLSISQYLHTKWTAAEGAPPMINALAQTDDGYLWLGSAAGVFRFDGVVFEHISVPDADANARRVTALLATSNGALWIGYDTGHFAVWRNGVVEDASTSANDRYVIDLVETSDGAVWALLGRPENPLMRNVSGRWEEIGLEWGLPRDWPIAADPGSNGELYLTTLGSAFVLRAGARRFEHLGDMAGNAAIAEDAAGNVWISDARGTWRLDQRNRSFPTVGARRSTRTRFDRDGNLWGLNQTGLYRVRTPANSIDAPRLDAHVETYSNEDGLTSNAGVSFLEDREGNIWIGTSLGLDRFRAVNVIVERNQPTIPQFGFDLFGASDGAIYVGGGNGIYIARAGEELRPFIETPSHTTAICEAADGTLWFFLRDRLLRVRGQQVAAMSLPEPDVATGYHHCAVDRHNVLWVTAQRDGVFSLSSGRWMRHETNAENWRQSLIADRERRILHYLISGDVVRADDRGNLGPVVFSDERISAVYDASTALWIGGNFGIARVGADTRTLNVTVAPWASEPVGFVETPTGQTWFIGAAGIVGLETAALERALEAPSAPVNPIVLSFADGLPNIFNRVGGRDAAVGGDGRVWFATISNIVWVNPAELVRNMLPPPVTIRNLSAGERSVRDPVRVDLSAGSSNVSIQYTALSFSIPERVRFRYRLEGVDRDWVDAGARREVQYSNLGLGNYRFHVIAANNDGVWNEEGASVEFRIAPTFLQSIWFKFILVLAFCLLAWVAYALRLREETARITNRYDVRMAERERIARELHDTLLQSFQALTLRFQLIADRFGKEDAVRLEMDEALDRADGALIEGRERVADLRRGGGGDLQHEIADLAASAIQGASPRFEMIAEGAPRTLHAIVSEEVLRIAEQAILNAVQHAGAAEIEATLSYSLHALRLSVRDDGVGIDKDIVEQGARSGHFGLIGMRERASRIGGELSIASRKDAGTEVSLVVPARSAYQNRTRDILDFLFPGRRREP